MLNWLDQWHFAYIRNKRPIRVFHENGRWWVYFEVAPQMWIDWNFDNVLTALQMCRRMFPNKRIEVKWWMKGES